VALSIGFIPPVFNWLWIEERCRGDELHSTDSGFRCAETENSRRFQHSLL